MTRSDSPTGVAPPTKQLRVREGVSTRLARLDQRICQSRALKIAVTLAVAAWWLCVGFAFAPGGTSPDVFLQYQQGLAGEYTNLHPPLLSFLLGGSGRLFGTPAPVFWLQTGLYFGLATLLALRARRHALLALVLLALFVTLPPSWAIAATLWKDVWFALAILIAALGLALPRSRLRLALLVIASIAAAVFRYNAVPFGVALVGYAAWTTLRPGWQRGVAALGLATLVFFSPRLMDATFGASEEWSFGTILVYDAVGIYVREPEAFAGSPLAAIAPFQRLRDAYVPEASWRIIGAFGIPGLRYYELSPLREPLTAEWTRLVARYPGAYLKHRWMVFSRLLGLGMQQQLSLFGETTTRGLFAGPDLTHPVHRFFDTWRKSWVRDFPFKVWFWLLCLGAAISFAAYQRHADALILGVLISGYFALYFLAAASAEFRYAHPLLVSAFVIPWILFASPSRWPRPGTSPPQCTTDSASIASPWAARSTGSPSCFHAIMWPARNATGPTPASQSCARAIPARGPCSQ